MRIYNNFRLQDIIRHKLKKSSQVQIGKLVLTNYADILKDMTSKLIKELSVFFPCYNEEKNIKNTVDKAIPVLKKITDKWEIILVNDGSKDKTAQVLEKIKKDYPKNIKIVTHNPNRGYGAAFKSGVYNSQYEWIAFTDADGQFDFSEVTNV